MGNERNSHEHALVCYSKRRGSILKKMWPKEIKDLLPGLMLVMET